MLLHLTTPSQKASSCNKAVSQNPLQHEVNPPYTLSTLIREGVCIMGGSYSKNHHFTQDYGPSNRHPNP